MTLTLDELITEAERSVALAEATLQSLRREKLNQILASFPEDIEARFWAWCDSGVADNNHGCIFHCVSSSGKDLFEYESYMFSTYRVCMFAFANETACFERQF